MKNRLRYNHADYSQCEIEYYAYNDERSCQYLLHSGFGVCKAFGNEALYQLKVNDKHYHAYNGNYEYYKAVNHKQDEPGSVNS